MFENILENIKVFENRVFQEYNYKYCVRIIFFNVVLFIDIEYMLVFIIEYV